MPHAHDWRNEHSRMGQNIINNLSFEETFDDDDDACNPDDWVISSLQKHHHSNSVSGLPMSPRFGRRY